MSEKLLKNCLKGLAFSLILTAVLLILFTFIGLTRDDPDNYLTAFAYSALLLPVLCGAFLSSKFNKESGVLCGFLTGISYILIHFLLSLILKNDGGNPKYIVYGIAVILSCVGGFLGLPNNKKRKSQKKKRIAKR